MCVCVRVRCLYIVVCFAKPGRAMAEQPVAVAEVHQFVTGETSKGPSRLLSFECPPIENRFKSCHSLDKSVATHSRIYASRPRLEVP